MTTREYNEEKQRAKLKVLEKNFTPEQILAMEFIAEQAVARALQKHSDDCPFQKRIFGYIGKGVLIFLAALGAAAVFGWHAIKTWMEHNK